MLVLSGLLLEKVLLGWGSGSGGSGGSGKHIWNWEAMAFLKSGEMRRFLARLRCLSAGF
jgi:hypothetical protein